MLKLKGVFRNSTLFGNLEIFQPEIPEILAKKQALTLCDYRLASFTRLLDLTGEFCTSNRQNNNNDKYFYGWKKMISHVDFFLLYICATIFVQTNHGK